MRSFRCFFSGAIVLALSLAAFVPAYSAVDPHLSAKTFFPSSYFPVAEQRRLAGRLLGKKWLRDAEAEDYLQRIANRLAPQDENFLIVANTDAVNAFAYLGGLIIVYRGLFDFADEEEGFISIIAHEMAHIKLRHVRKSRENAERTSMLVTPILLAGLLADDPEVREAMVAGGAGLLSSDVIIYSRELEHEADVAALDAIIAAGYNPQSMVRIFSRFESSGNEYLSTHPSSERRAAYLSGRLHDVITANAPTPVLDYYLLREKMGRRGDVIEKNYQQEKRRVLASETATANEKKLAQYGLLLAANKTRNAALGEEMTAALREENNPLIIRALAKNLRQRGKSEEAIRLLEIAHAEYPDHRALVLELFAAYEQKKLYQKALSLYQALPPQRYEHPDILRAAGRAAAFLKQNFLSNYLLAYGQALDGAFEQALRQIAVAETFKSTDTEITLKLDKLKKEVRRELKLIRERRVLEDG